MLRLNFFVGIIFFFALSVVPAKTLAAARFYLSPSSGSYKVGDTISASVIIDSGGQAINSAEASLTYAQDTLEYQSVGTTGSIFSFWTNGPTGGSTQTNFSGGAPNPGYNGGSGKVVTLTWKAKSAGTATVTINGSKILANDGNGTNVYGSSSGGTFTITQATPKPVAVSISSSSHPDQAKWYNVSKAVLSWSAGSATSFVYTLDQNSSTDPSGSPATQKSKTFDKVADGTWYLHVKAQTDTGFTSTAHFRIQIDTQPPDPFTVTATPKNPTDPTPVLTFETKDALSGLDRYELAIDGGSPVTIKSGDKLPKQSPGEHTITITAFDKAGNTTKSETKVKITGIAPPKIVSWTKRVRIGDPVSARGVSDSTDLIIVFLDGKEIERFMAKDHLTNDKVNDQSIWEWHYDALLPLGKHTLTFRRVNEAGAESELTSPYDVTILLGSVKIFGQLVSMMALIFILIAISIILLLLCIYLWLRLRHVIIPKLGLVANFLRIERLFTRK